jgi:beta-lactamase superfamily II metal-dependent hydrolase
MRLARRTLLALCAWLALAPASARSESQRLRVDFVAVGQGDAALITSPTGKTVLIDGGPSEAGAALAAFVHSRTTSPLDLVLLTHPHSDHLGGLGAVIRRQGARLFMDAPSPHRSPAYAALLDVIERRRIPVRNAAAGRTIDLGGGARLVLLAPPAPAITGTRSDVNANSVVARLEHGQVRMLFMGDAEAHTERWLLASGAELRASVLKVAHHGSRHSSGAAFLRAVSPAIAVVSCGARNEYRHPHPATVERLIRAGARVVRTDREGTVSISSDGRVAWIEASRRPLVGSRP